MLYTLWTDRTADRNKVISELRKRQDGEVVLSESDAMYSRVGFRSSLSIDGELEKLEGVTMVAWRP